MSRVPVLRARFLCAAILAFSLVAFAACPSALSAAIVGQYSLNCGHVNVSCSTPCVEIDVCVDLPTKCFPKCISRNLKCDQGCDVQRVKGFCEPRNDCRDYVRDCRDYDKDRKNCEKRCDKPKDNNDYGGRSTGNLVASVLKLVKSQLKDDKSDSYASNRLNNDNSKNHSSTGSESSKTVTPSASSINSIHQNSNQQSSRQGSSSRSSGQAGTNSNSKDHKSTDSSKIQNSSSTHQANNGPSLPGNSKKQDSNKQDSKKQDSKKQDSKKQDSKKQDSNKQGHSDGFTQSPIESEPNHILAFSVKADAGSSVLLKGLSFDDKRNCYGPMSGVVQYSFDGFETVADRFCFDVSTCWRHECWDFCDFVLKPCETVDFRFVLKDALNWCYGTFCLKNVKVKGCKIEEPPTSVPEPGSLSLAAMALVLGVGSRYTARRRRES